MSKQRLGKDYIVAPLEGQWWSDDPAAFENAQKSEYQWTMMIMQPDWITETLVSEAVTAAAAKKELPALSKVRFERYDEGRSLQLQHVGSYDDEAPKLKYLHAEFMPLHKLTFNGSSSRNLSQRSAKDAIVKTQDHLAATGEATLRLI
jgi:hypothetical protein